jgi:hypothetical protein
MLRHVSVARILVAGAFAAALATIANLAVRAAAISAFGISPAFTPLHVQYPIAFTVIGGLGASIVLAVLSRADERPIDRFLRVSAVVLLLSLVPDLYLLVVRQGYPGTTVASAGTLMVMHVVAALIIVPTILWAVTGRALRGPGGVAIEASRPPARPRA